ncbi:DHH family phosphoesterase [Methanocalculus taiwanensis]|uniref:DHH family phosphoesterase n=1 Tax=Methanocalculus taiwanensis TaxID=106207 RepID=A0ABD4TIJ6_9EURY|nr:DHH family phosphoesterase [Methanocalculus taiwanensis]MCQ1538516.1 DHH family phosphoesterase [Methanocalculus taiwanensis]
MPLTPSTELLAQHLKSAGFVEVYAHHDVDGIAAASLLCTALSRIQVPFHLHIRSTIRTEMIPTDCPVLLCDFGSSLSDLPSSVMVIDHHIPSFTGEFHVNPRLYGIDGDRELSTSGAAYYVARELGDNRDCAGLAVLGAIGDRQEFRGANREIVNEGIGNGVISTKPGFMPTGRTLYDSLFLATDPYLPGISGTESVCRDLAGNKDPDISQQEDSLFLSRLVLGVNDEASAEALQRLVADSYHLEREVIPWAPAMAAVIDACGKSGHGGLAVSLCMGDPAGIEEAWSLFSAFRQRIISGMDSTEQIEPGWYRVDDLAVASDIADLLSTDLTQSSPVFVITEDDDFCSVSARTPPGCDLNLDRIVRTAATAVGGSGGGHIRRAGATIPAGKDVLFRQAVIEAISA